MSAVPHGYDTLTAKLPWRCSSPKSLDRPRPPPAGSPKIAHPSSAGHTAAVLHHLVGGINFQLTLLMATADHTAVGYLVDNDTDTEDRRKVLSGRSTHPNHYYKKKMYHMYHMKVIIIIIFTICI